MTERLYYRDAYMREFAAQVASCAPVNGQAGSGQEKGEQAGVPVLPRRWRVRLDRTAFYPTSGGQPHDTGTLGAARVVEVLDAEDGGVEHLTDAPVAAGPVRGAIDWERRRDHMQQHTGQHVLSAAFVRLCGRQTVSFHLGRESSTIDLAGAEPSAQELEQAEQEANRVVFDNLPVEIGFASAAELAEMGVRKAMDPAMESRARGKALRYITIVDFDRQPCGGTHVARTGEIGLILLRKVEKQKQSWRVEFVCGARALAAAREDYRLLGEVAGELSCHAAETPELMRRAMADRQEMYHARQRLLEQLAEYEAVALLAEADPSDPGHGVRLISRVFEEAGADYLRMLATRLASHPDVLVLVATRESGHVIFAQSPGLAADMNALLRESLGAFGGRGGGRKDFAQGSVPATVRLEQVLENARERLRG